MAKKEPAVTFDHVGLSIVFTRPNTGCGDGDETRESLVRLRLGDRGLLVAECLDYPKDFQARDAGVLATRVVNSIDAGLGFNVVDPKAVKVAFLMAAKILRGLV